MKTENKTTIAFTILGIIVGYVSYLLKNNYLSLTVAVIFLYVAYEAFKRIFKIDEKFKWFWSNGGWIYIFIWFIVWIIFYNL
jgi:uncharacterized membrane protein YfcA